MCGEGARTRWRSTSVSSFRCKRASWLPLQHAIWVRVVFFWFSYDLLFASDGNRLLLPVFDDSGKQVTEIRGNKTLQPIGEWRV